MQTEKSAQKQNPSTAEVSRQFLPSLFLFCPVHQRHEESASCGEEILASATPARSKLLQTGREEGAARAGPRCQDAPSPGRSGDDGLSLAPNSPRRTDEEPWATSGWPGFRLHQATGVHIHFSQVIKIYSHQKHSCISTSDRSFTNQPLHPSQNHIPLLRGVQVLPHLHHFSRDSIPGALVARCFYLGLREQSR